MDNFKEFINDIENWEKKGLAYGISDLDKLAKIHKNPIPKSEYVKAFQGKLDTFAWIDKMRKMERKRIRDEKRGDE